MSDRPAPGATPPAPGGAGPLLDEQGTASVVFRRVLAHPVQEVWAAVTEPRELEQWFMVKVTGTQSPGGLLEMRHANGVSATGRVLEWRPPRSYEYEWNLPPGPSRPDGEASIVRWELTPVEGGTLLVLTHRKLSRPAAEVFARGLSVFLDRLSAQLDGQALPAPPWMRGASPPSPPA
jgi:uncharacterized protein YndB with AHSA1/START domain